MELVDFDTIILVRSEKVFLRKMSRAGRLPLPPELRHLYVMGFVQPNYTDERDELNSPVQDGTYSTTPLYARYIEHRRAGRLEHLVVPVIVGVLSATVTYLLESLILPLLLKLL